MTVTTTVSVTQGIQSPGRKYNSRCQDPSALGGGYITTFELGITPSMFVKWVCSFSSEDEEEE